MGGSKKGLDLQLPLCLWCVYQHTLMSKNTNVKGEARPNLSPKCSVQMLNERGKK